MNKDSALSRRIFRKHGGFYLPAVRAVGFAMRVLLWLRVDKDEAVKNLQRSGEGFLVLSAHPSLLDGAVLYVALAPTRLQTVAGRFQFVGKKSEPLFRLVGAIPKKQFYPDTEATRAMIRTVRENRVLAMMPEGRVSIDGTAGSMDRSIAGFVKHCGLDVVTLLTDNSYFTMPPWRSGLTLTPIHAHLKRSITKEELPQLDEDEIFDILKKDLSYDMCACARRYFYLGNRKGISNVLYRCPSCGALDTVRDNGRKLWCTECGMKARIRYDRSFVSRKDPRIPKDIARWNKMQIEEERAFFRDNSCIACAAEAKKIDDQAQETAREQGVLRLSKEGFAFTAADGSVKFSRSLAETPALSIGYTGGTVTFAVKDGGIVFTCRQNRNAARFVNALRVLREEAGLDRP